MVIFNRIRAKEISPYELLGHGLILFFFGGGGGEEIAKYQ